MFLFSKALLVLGVCVGLFGHGKRVAGPMDVAKSLRLSRFLVRVTEQCGLE